MNNTEDTIRMIIADKLGKDIASIVPEAGFLNDLGADSIDTVELILKIEEQFGIEIPNQDVEQIVKVSDLIDYVKKKINLKL